VTLEQLVATIDGFAALGHGDKIKIFMWWLHTHQKRERIQPREVTACYTQLSIAATNVGTMMNWLESKQHLIKNKQGYRLERTIDDELTAKYGQREATIHVEKLLTDLPGKLSNDSERAYLEETLICFRNRAFRAAVIMVWNLTYDHLCQWIIRDPKRLADFNVQLPKSYAKKNYSAISKRDSFEEMKESEALQVASSAGIITGNLHKILKEKLDRRNVAAHPSDVKTLQPTAEEVIRDLIENVVLKLT
jgi:hypothetical protein